MSVTSQRTAVVRQVADLIAGRRRPGRVLRVGIDVVRTPVDGFHHPAAVRYRQGRSSPRGFYEDSHD